MPGSHGVQTDAPFEENSPGPQGAHSDAPPAAYLPAVHVTQTVAPAPPANEPASHGAQFAHVAQPESHDPSQFVLHVLSQFASPSGGEERRGLRTSRNAGHGPPPIRHRAPHHRNYEDDGYAMRHNGKTNAQLYRCVTESQLLSQLPEQLPSQLPSQFDVQSVPR